MHSKQEPPSSVSLRAHLPQPLGPPCFLKFRSPSFWLTKSSLSFHPPCVIFLLVLLSSQAYCFDTLLSMTDESFRTRLSLADCFRIVWQPSLLAPLYSTRNSFPYVILTPSSQHFLHSPSAHSAFSSKSPNFSHYTFSVTFSILNV